MRPRIRRGIAHAQLLRQYEGNAALLQVGFAAAAGQRSLEGRELRARIGVSGGSAPASSVLSCRYEDRPRVKRSCSAQKECSMNLSVGNLAFTTTEAEVRQLFEGYGTVDTVRLLNDRETGQPRGFGFVEMSNGTEARAAMAGLHGKDVGGRSLIVNEARPREERGGPRRGPRW